MAASEIPSLDEIPVLAVAAAVAEGTTVFFDVGELRVKEVDRLAAVIDMVDGLRRHRPGRGRHARRSPGAGGSLRGARFDSRGDHRMAMAAAVAALAAAPGERSLITGFGAVETSYPGFADDLRRLTTWTTPTDRAPRAAARRHRRPGRARASRPSRRRWPNHLGLDRLDTGAMYRAVAALALARAIAPDGRRRRGRPGRRPPTSRSGTRVVIDGLDVTDVIRSPEVGTAVSVVAANAEVRAELVRRQRAWAAAHGGGVVEGRDIGTVVFPDAEVKVYLTASPEERARRRHDEAADGVARRDRIDSTRDASPLRQADDAHLLDTTGRTVQDVVEEVLSWL